MTARVITSVAIFLASCIASSVAFVSVGVLPTSKHATSGALSAARSTSSISSSRRTAQSRFGAAPIRPVLRCEAEGGAAAGDGDPAVPEEADDDEEEEVDESAEGVAKMRASEIKAELDMRGVGYAGIFEKEELVDKLVEARSLGRADPSLVDDFNKENLERKMDPERAASFAEDLLDAEKLKNLTAADGTLPGGLTPEQLSKFVANPEVMVLMQNAKMQEVMKKVMAGGPEAMESLQKDPETAELLQRLDKAMASVK